MRILKFEGATMRDAIAKVKAELGDQAVIIATRQVRKGLLGTATEISAAIDDDDAPAFAAAKPSLAVPPPAAPVPPRQTEQEVEKSIAPLRSELRSLRALVRTSSDSRSSNELKNEVAELRKLVEELRPRAERNDRLERNERNERVERNDQRSAMERSYDRHVEKTERPSNDGRLVARSIARAIMLVGPTGAGKTTTIAKLAANAALVEGKRVKLVTLDNFRVGGVDQIRTFADLIGVPLAVCETTDQLHDELDGSYDLILIDTAGRSPRETAPIAELADVVADLPSVEVHIVIPASSSAQQIDKLVGRYQSLNPARLLFTKLDEVDAAPELTRAPQRTRLPITWVTTGQAVPEDLEEPTRARLFELAESSVTRAA
jgi:flagellar biosynthesis protein FlhF